MKVFFTILVFGLIGCSTGKFKESDVKLKLRVLHTNDHHGHYLPDSSGQYGMAARKTLIDQLRSQIKNENGHHILLSGGDINTGTMESDIFDAEPDFKGMKALGYDAMAVGNHEFDNSYKTLLKQRKWAGFPFLSANIFWKGTERRVFEPSYIIKNYNGIKVGVFGLTTKDTPFKASHDDAKRMFDFKDITDSARVIVKELREKEKVDLVFAVTHVGHYGSSTSNGDIDLAKKVNGIDVIIGGHSQEIINAEEHNDTIIVQAEDWGKYVGVLDLIIGNNNKKLSFNYKLIPVNLKKRVKDKKVFIEKEIPQDEELEKFFTPYKNKAEVIGKKVVGHLEKTLDGARGEVRRQQMPIGQFMAASLNQEIKGLDIIVLNGGSIRSSLEKGPVSRKKIHNVHPYGNTISSVKFTPTELFNYFSIVGKKAIVDPKNIIGGYPQIGKGKLTLVNGELVKIEAKNKSWKIEKIGNELESTKDYYYLGTMNFLAKGGDNYPKISDHKHYVDTGFMINTAMMNYVEKKKKITLEKFNKGLDKIITIK